MTGKDKGYGCVGQIRSAAFAACGGERNSRHRLGVNYIDLTIDAEERAVFFRPLESLAAPQGRGCGASPQKNTETGVATMHRLPRLSSSFLACALLILALIGPAFAADQPTHIRGLWLTTDYPSITAQAGHTTTIKAKLQNYGLPPQRATLSLDGVPTGWKATILGGGAPITAAMPASDDSVQLQLRIEIPEGLTNGTHTITLRAKTQDTSASLPIDVSIGQVLPAQLALKVTNPSLIGTAKTSFGFQFNIANQSDRDLIVKLAANAPRGFTTNFTEAYGSQQIASIPIEAGKDKDLKVNVQPPADAKAGSYPVAIEVSADGTKADGSMMMDITGQPQLTLTGEDGRLSTSAVAGTTSPVALVLSNDGSAPAQEIALSASPPSDWKVSFQPDKIAQLNPGQKINIQAQLTPSSKAVAGDYMTTLRANDSGSQSSSADIRVTVSTSTLWGIVGVAIVAIALLIAVGAVARFGRR